jgi:hypothetical protein
MQKSQALPRRTRPSRVWGWFAVPTLLFLAAFALLYAKINRAEPTLRAVVIDTLSTRFDSKVELDSFHVSPLRGFEVSGTGLRLFGKDDPNNNQPGVQPLISAPRFSFHMALRDFFRSPKHVDTVYIQGLVLNLPPREQRAGSNAMGARRKIEIAVDHLVCDRVVLIINTLKPGKLPLEFDIESLKMTTIGPTEPMHFEARLTNPKPVGDIVSSGSFGPWRADSPRATPVGGVYTFQNANLGTIKGIGGILSSEGQYAGTLDRIEVDGATDTPDFQLAISGLPVPLHTDFHAIIDGTSGDTYLQPVRAKLLTTSFEAAGSIVRTKDPAGHDVELDITLEQGRIEDLLKLAVRTVPPIMTGTVRLQTKLSLPPGDPDVPHRLNLGGNFRVSSAHFNNEKIQQKVDALSMRSQGKPQLAVDDIPDNMRSRMSGTFRLRGGVLSFSQLEYRVPGARVNLTGAYSLDGNQFDFHGKARLDAKLSHMVTGWKSILLKPVDPFFSKHGAGTELPVKINGTKSEPRFGLDFGHKN